MVDYTLSGAALFDGSNPLDIETSVLGALVFAASITGVIEGEVEFDGGVFTTIGASNPPGGTEHLAEVEFEFDGFARATVALFHTPAHLIELGTSFAGSLDVVEVGGAIDAEIGAAPIVSTCTVLGALVVNASISGVIELEGDVTGAVKHTSFIGLGDVAGNEFVDVEFDVIGEPTVAILQSPPYAFFDGTDDYIAHAGTSDVALNGGAEFSVAFIIDPEIADTGNSGVICGKHDGGSTQSGWYVAWDVTTGLVTARFASTLDGSNTAVRPNATAIRTRSAVVVTYDGTDINIYVTGIGLDNGTQTGTAGAMVSNTARFAIGARDVDSTPTGFYRGAVHGVWVWDAVLDSGEAAQVDPYGVFDMPAAADLQVAWTPWELHASASDAFFASWIDTEGGRPLQPAGGLTGKPLVLSSHLDEVLLLADVWDVNFVNGGNLYGNDQNLSSNYPLATSATDASENGKWRLFSPPSNQDHPEVASGYRNFRTDITVVVVLRRPAAGTNAITIIELLGLRLQYDVITSNLWLFEGDTGTPTRHEFGTQFSLAASRKVTFALRYNSVTGQFSVVEGDRVLAPVSTTVTGTAASASSLELCVAADYASAFVIAACVPDNILFKVLGEFAGDISSFVLAPYQWRTALRRDALPEFTWGSVLVPSDVAFPVLAGHEPALPYIALPATGTIELSGQPADGDRVRVRDGEASSVTFEFNSGGGVGAGNVAVTIGANVGLTMDNLVTAINASALNITAAARTNFDSIGDGTPDGAYTILTHGTVPTDPQNKATERDIEVQVNTSGNVLVSGMARGLASVERFEAIVLALATFESPEITAEHFQFSDNPYAVTEFAPDQLSILDEVPFVNPLPVIVSVTASEAHVVTAVANAGPTDAGAVRSWWEIELEANNVETVIRVDEQANNFSQAKSQLDTFSIPLGLNLDGRRIRFVIQSQVDVEQMWASLFFRMDGDEFNNSETEVIIIPGTGAPEPPPTIDLTISLQAQQFALEEEAQVRRALLQLSSRSRYKLARAFVNAKDDPRLLGRNIGGFEFGLLPTLPDFDDVGTQYRVHEVRQEEVGFLDGIARRFYGDGFEDMWWVIAYVNAIINPEQDMFAGQRLLVPSRDLVTRFLNRKAGADQGGT